ncbi:MAG: hypothetical protein IJ247_04535 [Bacilli bacterium]|nr:hypothetical protein [Bacilli bacterium]
MNGHKTRKLFVYPFIVLFLNACRFPVAEKDVIFKETINLNVLDHIDIREAKLKKHYSDEGFTLLYEKELFESGFVKFKQAGTNGNKYGVKFLYNGLNTAKYSYNKYEVIISKCNGNYIALADANDEEKIDIYDFEGRIVFQGVEKDASISLDTEIVELELREEALLERWTINDSDEYKIVNKYNIRSSKIPANLLLKTKNGEYYPCESPLDSIGLSHKTGSISKEGLFSCGNASFAIPAYDVGAFVWKSFVFQENEDEMVTSGRFDILTGEKHIFDFDKKIESIRLIKDIYGQDKYMLADIDDERHSRLVLDNEFKVVIDVTDSSAAYCNDLEKLTNFIFFSKEKNAIVDYLADESFSLEGKPTSYSYSLKTFAVQKDDGNVYLVDLENKRGKDLGTLSDVNIKYPNYKKGIAKNQEGKFVCIDIEEKTAELSSFQPEEWFDTDIGIIVYQSDDDLVFNGYSDNILTSLEGELIEAKSFNTYATKYSVFSVNMGSYTQLLSIYL